jgi:glycosyltransferase involved in cell wall biosynthesis
LSEALVSVVTPFHNSDAYLAECIESVLAQSHQCFEYILVDNCSTDRSGEIAEAYAQRDSRIRLIRRSSLLSQVQNYNAALAEISDSSRYCKLVQADDAIAPDCLRLMVQAFEQSESVGLVSSYYLKGNTVCGSGFPAGSSLINMLSGKEMARLYLRTSLFVFGSPTAVMYRSSIVRQQRPFYDESRLHEDTEKCMQILQEWEFGFVRQILCWLRVENESISGRSRNFLPESLDGYIIVQRYASTFLDAAEAQALKREAKREYYRALVYGGLRSWHAGYWRYHREGLKSLGQVLDLPYLTLQAAMEALSMAVNPGTTVTRALRAWRRRFGNF